MFVDGLIQIVDVTADGPPDIYGEPTETTTSTTVDGVWFPGPAADDLDRPDGQIDGTVFVRPDVTVSATSRVTVPTVGVVNAEVVGRPKRWLSPRTGAVEFTQLEVTVT